MSSSRRPEKEVATLSQKKRSQSGNVPLAPAVPKGQTRRFGVNDVPMKGKHARSHYMTVRGRNVPFTPTGINDILGIPQDANPLVLIGLIIRLPYQAIRHTLCGPQSMVQWTDHSGKRYHQSLPYAHMLRETRIWLKVVMNCLITGLHYTDITRDKARVHKGHMYAFGGLITQMCRTVGVPEENVDYMAPLYPAPCHMRDELITAKMYGLEMLHHQNSCHTSTDMQLGEVERCYPLNNHAKALLGIGPAFHEPIDNDIPTDEERAHTSSNVDFDSKEEIDPAQAGDEAEGAMRWKTNQGVFSPYLVNYSIFC
ncbi:hypothetical protein R3W88_031922 [Solanum pinnatisectum]|uniref:Putative plant transposon protein domain-containing protein n=1 Tax=Solanum pinnatisectum TaxID=50273 RepID=A0AAV9LQC2_9SOLN|nr:hypothetical protein R3W88_031922 [Solanum pinnatisectum]